VIGISDAQRTALASLAPSLDPGTYLAGGVALATVYGHRQSQDLDLFVPSEPALARPLTARREPGPC
jgi:hypothetical protein